MTAAAELDEAQEELPGRLFIVEGIDGSGKSTQLDLLHKWLTSRGYLVVFSEWNSSTIVKGTTRRGKKRRLLSPVSFSLIHAADFASRVYSQIRPALEAGAIVLADRYVYTAFARDSARGISRSWLRELYSFAVRPTTAFYFDVPLDVAVSRIMEGRPVMKYYEAGMDLGLSDDPQESFRLYQAMIRDEYERLVEEFDLVRIAATENIIVQQRRVRDLVLPFLEGVPRLSGSTTQEALREAGLVGRYLQRGAVEEPQR
ncbi:MAG: thymidylate kinase [Actinomycetota bacterium]|nr:thymidylate kinase [Actinomycetota bacterium]